MKPTIVPLRQLARKLPPGILFGGDYNPEQWPESLWPVDAPLMRAAGVNLVSVGIFSWAKLEPAPGTYDFGWLDRVIDGLWAEGVSVCLANATASPPPWLSRAHPESLPVDRNGTRLSPGSRQHYCPNSRAYRTAAARLSRELATRYSQHPAVALWHVNNEIGCHSYECFCDVCAADFRAWLRRRYDTLPALNEAWGTAFWSQAFGDWEEILPPRKMMTFRNPGQALDYHRFMSDALRDILVGEVAAIRAVCPDAVVTTNGLNFTKATDYWEWYRHVDIAAWDSYPDPAAGIAEVRVAAFNHDLYRCLRGGQPFMLMEQTASQVNWRATNQLKPPGQMRALSLQAVAHGADAVMYFQWRASRAGAEKFHGAMVPHFGPEGRVHGEVRALGAELKKLGDVCGARTAARVAVLVSWENFWAIELESKPAVFDYAEIVHHYYGALWGLNVPLDLAHPDHDFDGYDVVIAPALYQLTRPQADRLRAFVRRGGLLVMSYFSGVCDANDQVWLGGYPALLQDVLGVVVEEWQPLAPGQRNSLRPRDHDGEVPCEKFCDLVHLRGAEALATFASDFFAGRAAVTTHRFGSGEACYVATHPDAAWLARFLGERLRSRGIVAPVRAGPGVEVCVRRGADEEFLFVINHQATSSHVEFRGWVGTDLLNGEWCDGPTTLAPFAAHVLRRRTVSTPESPS